MAEALFDGGQNSDVTRFAGFDPDILDLVYASDVEGFVSVQPPRARRDFITDAKDELLDKLPDSDGHLRAQRKSYQSFVDSTWDRGEPTSSGSDVTSEHKGSRNGQEVQSCQQLTFDPTSIRSMMTAGLGIARPLARSVGIRARNFAAPVPERAGQILPPLSEPSSMLPSDIRIKLRQASGLPEGPILPHSLADAGYRSLDRLSASRRQLLMGTAVPVTAALALSMTSNIFKNDVGNQAVQAFTNRPSTAAEYTKPLVADLVSVEVKYVPSKATHVRSVAIDLGMPTKELASANNHLDPNSEVPAGTVLQGTIKASRVEVPEPTTPESLANLYGLTPDAIRSVNELTEDGLVEGEVYVPGRVLVQTNSAETPDISALAVSLELSDVATRELNRVNAAAPEGQLVVKLSEAIEPQLDNIPELVQTILPSGDSTSSSSPEATTASGHPENQSPVVSSALSPSTTTASTSTTIAGTPSISEALTSETVTSTAPSTTVAQEVTSSLPAPEPAAAPAPEIIVRPATPAEQLEAERQAIGQAVELARATGDAGPLRHLVAFSPLFEPTNLPDRLKEPTLRRMPPANLLGIPGILYEFSTATPSNERIASVDVVVSALVAAYTMQYEIKNTSQFTYLDGSCIRFGDFSALHGHKSHNGDEVDMSSALHCSIIDGRAQADGPIFWINRVTNGISQQITNPNYNPALEFAVLSTVQRLTVDGRRIIGSTYYNAPLFDDSPYVQPMSNHSNHIHVGDAANTHGKGDPLKDWADGGNRPERDLRVSERELFLLYTGGKGVPGVSLDLTVSVPLDQSPAQPQPETVATSASIPQSGEPQQPGTTPPSAPTPAAAPPSSASPQAELDVAQQLLEQAANPSQGLQHAFFRTLLLNEIASGEGGYDSTNRGRPNDTQIGDANYRRIFGDRNLSQHTIIELMNLQREGKILTVGRYQMIPGTFRSAVEATGIDVNRVFDAQTQDELATEYLIFMKRPNLSAYIKGDESKLYLAVEDLCKEFASMPCNDGSGHYDGDSAGNAAHGGRARVARIVEILEHLRTTYLGAQMEIAVANQA